jgi:hypothetical protein
LPWQMKAPQKYGCGHLAFMVILLRGKAECPFILLSLILLLSCSHHAFREAWAPRMKRSTVPELLNCKDSRTGHACQM